MEPSPADAHTLDLVVVGAGPIGLETAILAGRAGLACALLDKGCVVNAVFNYPTYMTFFTTSERLEVGGHPLVTATDKPTRKEALDYYRKVAANEGLKVRQFSEVTRIRRAGDGFEVAVKPDKAAPYVLKARKVAVATGYFDNPKLLGVPGEGLPHVSHYYSEAHPFWGRRVTIIGAGSSAADAALDLHRGGAFVTMIHRGEGFRHSLKYWIRPNLENRVQEGSIAALFNTTVKAITPEAVVAERSGEEIVVPSDQVFALTGYYANSSLLTDAGVRCQADYSAVLDPETFESNVSGLYVVGSAGFGTRTSDVFIENGLVHARAAVADMVQKLKLEPVLS